MPFVTVKDPATGEMVQLYQAPTAAPAAPAAPTPKPVAPAPAPAAPAPKPTPAVASAPSSNPLDQFGKAVQGGLQNLAKDVSDRGKESNASVGVARGLARMAYSGARNTAQELSDVGSEVVAAAQGKPSPTRNFTRDAPFLGIAPPLPKAKSSGPVEDFVTGIGQFALGFGFATKAVTGGAKLATKVPGVARAFGAVDDITAAATTAVKASKAAQVIGAVPLVGPVAKFAGKAIATGVKENTATKGAAAGALVDFAAFDQYEGRLTDLVAKVGGPFEVFALDYLKSDPKDEGLTGRLKNVIEGAGAGALLGTGVELLVQTFKATRAMRAASQAADIAKRTELVQLAVKERAKLDEVLIKQRDLPDPRLAVQPGPIVKEINLKSPDANIEPPVTPRAPDPRTAVAPVGNTNMAAAAIEPPVLGREPDPYQGLDPKERALLEEEDKAALAGQMGRTERAGINYERAITNRPPLPDAAALDPQQRQLDPDLNPQRAQLDPELDPQQRQLAPQVDPPAAPRPVVTSDDIVLPDSAFRKLTNAKANSAAEAYRKLYNAGQAPENQIELAQALAAVRAKGQRFVADGVPGLDIDSALRDMQTGRFTPEVEKLRNAYIEAYSDQPMTVLAQTPTAAVDPQLDPQQRQLDPAAPAPAERPLVKPGAELSHGTSEAAQKSILTEGFRASEYKRSGTVAGEGVYMAPNERYAGEYGGKLVSGALPEDAKILNWTGSSQTLASLADEIGIAGPRELNKSADEVELNQAQQQQLKQWALDNGYDGIQYRTNFTPSGKAQEVVIYNIDLANRIVGSKAAAAIEPLVPGGAGGDVPPVPPVRGGEPPMPGDPNFPDSYPAKFIAAFEANTDAIKAGDTTIEDMLVNNVQKFESPSKQTAYVNTVPEDAVKAYRSFSDIISRADTFKTMNNAELEATVEESLKAHGYNVNVVLDKAQRSIDYYAQHRENLEATLSLQLAVDDFNAKAGIAASEYLMGAADGSPEHMRLITNMMGAAINAKVLNESLIKITRPQGALFQALQIARGDVGSRNFVIDIVNMPNVRDDITKGLEAKVDASIPEEIGASISADLEEALTTGEFGSKTLAELDALAGVMTQMSATKGFSRKAFKAFGNKGELLVRGLIILRASNLLSSGATMMTNIMSNTLRLFQLPVATATGLAMRGEWAASGHSMMMFNHYIYNMNNAFRLTNESFKAGRSLFDVDSASIDALAKEAATAKRFEDQGVAPENNPEWDLNTTPWINIQDRSNWAIAQRKIWQTLNAPTRLQVSLDTLFKTLSGSAFEYTRNLEPGMKRAMEQGMDPNGPEAWKFAQEFAQESLDQQITDLTINGKEILGAVMTGPHAQTAMRYTTFTDDIWAEGTNGFNIPNYARTMSIVPAAWQAIIDVAPIAALIQPFNRTPGDIVKAAARMTPGLNFLVDTYHRDINSGDKFTRARAEGDVAVGAIAISAGVLAMTTGYLQFAGSGPERDRVAMDKWRQDGWIPYSVRVRLGTDELGNTEYSRAVSMKALEPFTNLFGALGQYTDIANSLSKEDRDKLGTAIVFDVMVGVATGQLSKSYYQGFHEFMEFATTIGELGGSADKATRVEKYFAKLAVSFMPFRSAFNSARRQIDPALRVVEPGTEGNFLDSNLRNFPMRLYNQVMGELQNGIAGLSENLPERLNWIDAQPMYSASIFGSEYLPPEYPWMRGFLQFSPTSAFPIGNKISVIDREMALLHGKGAEFRGPSATDWGVENRLSAEELNRYIKITATTPNEFGETQPQALLNLMKSKHYQGLPREAPQDSKLNSRAIEVNRIIAAFRKRGKQEYENQNPVFANRIMSAEDLNNLAKYRAKYGRDAPLFPVVGK